ncbi:lipoyl protein ligase domain-containing protein [Tengunoibacter tsumagoiensis]|uniref:Ligase n=1 Tax=Tengunoibacter tsumagoiensis TaxID=2014871 RepID=A0A401ZY70_9CHLR|nr:hypothetical protein [Tengunoibacter tsumagoiensis]GCE11780.1 ligase [Tengunoibacter tsumagoiensis]
MITNWCIYPLTVADQQQHIARSEAFLQQVTAGDPPILYWSMADRAGLVLGFSQKSSIVNPESASHFPIYHRRAGGTAVLVGPTLLSLDVVLPADHPFVLADIVESYRWFGETWVAALRLLGVETRTVTPAEAHAQRARRKDPATSAYELLMQRACYGSISPYEVVAGQQKVVGLDMIRRKAGTLLQAGVLLRWETDQLAQILGHDQQEQHLLQSGLLERAVGLESLVGRVIHIDKLIIAFEQALTERLIATDHRHC